MLMMLIKARKPMVWKLGIAIMGMLGIGAAIYLGTRRASVSPNSSLLTAQVEVKTLRIQIKANGIVQPVRKINLSPKDSGRLVHLYVNEGDVVQQGQLIAEMDSERLEAQVRQYQASVTRSEANLKQKLVGNRKEDILKAQADLEKNEAQLVQAKSRLALASERVQRKQFVAQQGALARDALDEALTEERNSKDNLEQAEASLKVARQELLKQRSGSRIEEVEQAKAELAQATAQLQFYQTQLKDTLIRAPFAGIITRRFAEEGDFVTPTTSASDNAGATSTSIVELSTGLEVEAKVPESSIARIKPGQAVEIHADAYPDKTFQGQVRLISPRAVQENNVTSFRVKVALRTGQKQLKPAMNAQLVFLGEPIQNALTIPVSAISTKKDGQSGVWILDDKQQAKFQPVKVGFTSGSEAQILEGISTGQKVLLSPPEEQKLSGIDL